VLCRAAQRLLGGQFDYRLAAQQLEAAAQAVRTLSSAAAAAKARGLQPGQINSSSSVMDTPAAPQLPAYLAAAAAGASSDSEPGQMNSSNSSSTAAPELLAHPAAVGDGAASGAAAAAGVAAAAASWPGVLADVLSPLARFHDQEDGWQDVGAFSKVR
jgi:hypothetical protein